MKKLLHIIATPREDESRTLMVSRAFLETFKAKHPDWVVESLNLSKEKLPELTMRRVDGKYVLLSGKDLYGDLKDAWEEIIGHIERFLSADGYLVSTPMWNFSIPYMLKHYLDVILQPKYLFQYTPAGPEGLVKNRKMVVIASRGGDYSSEAMKAYDFQIPYLRAVFGFAGITDIDFAVTQPMDMGIEMQAKKIQEAQGSARRLAEKF
jgi:FMN-dependent NADH-azoreductase